MHDLRRNGSGYVDKTAEKAITSVIRYTKQDKRMCDVTKTIDAIKMVARAAGFEITNRVFLKDIETGKEYK